MKRLFLFLAVILTTTIAFSQPDNAGQRPRMPRFDTKHPDVHDPVMALGEDGRYYIFSTGMGVGVMSSADRKEWRREPSVLNPIPQWATDTVRGYRGHTWAPDISKHNGLWHLYYSCSTFGKNGSAIGLAVNKTLDPKSPDFRWEDRGMVIASHRRLDNFNAIDPNLVVDKNGQPYLTFGSFWDGIQMVKLSKQDFQTPIGKPFTISRRVGRKLTLAELNDVRNYTVEGGDTIEAGENAVEAPFIYRRGKYYYLFVSFDYCCRGAGSTYNTVYGRSKNITGPYLDQKGRPMEHGGGIRLYGPDETNFGIGHCAVYDFEGKTFFVAHAYEKSQGGRAKLFMRQLTFDKDGWIVPADDSFVKGADVGFLAGQERQGQKFYNRNGEERECLELLKNDYQMGAVRLRVWVNPRGGDCDKNQVLMMAKRAKALGMDVMIDFHYGDWWADPAKQPIPQAWLGHSYKQMKRDLQAHTREVLTLLRDNGIEPRWVQVGNETTNGMLWSVKTGANGWEVKDENGNTIITHSMGHIKTQPKHYAGFIRAGYDAVKEIFPNTIVIVHLDRGHLPDLYDWNLGIVRKYGGKFDMVGMSLYPYWAMEGHPELNADQIITDCMDNIRHVSEKFGCDVMIVETGFQVDEAHPEVMEEGRRQLTRVINEARTRTDGHCRGVFYWEPQCRPQMYKLGAFDSKGAPTAIMDGFIEK